MTPVPRHRAELTVKVRASRGGECPAGGSRSLWVSCFSRVVGKGVGEGNGGPDDEAGGGVDEGEGEDDAEGGGPRRKRRVMVWIAWGGVPGIRSRSCAAAEDQSRL